VLEVVGAVERIAPLVPDRVVRDGVDREVPAREVVHQRHPELHHGVPAVGLDVLAERGDLVLAILLVEHGDGTVLDPTGTVRLNSRRTSLGGAAVVRSKS